MAELALCTYFDGREDHGGKRSLAGQGHGGEVDFKGWKSCEKHTRWREAQMTLTRGQGGDIFNIPNAS